MKEHELKDAMNKIEISERMKKAILEKSKKMVSQAGNEMLSDNIKGRNKYMKHRIFRIAALAAAVTAITTASVFALSPTGQEIINSIISYFQNGESSEITSLEELGKYNEEIGKSVSKDGVTLTLDNVAADDNFIHVFYTVKSGSVPFYEGNSRKAAVYSDAVNMSADVCCVINGSQNFANHNTEDGYFADNYTYKAVEKYNISSEEIPDNFKVELFCEIAGRDKEYKQSDIFKKLYNEDGYNTITDEEKSKILYISASVSKSKAKVETVSKKIDVKLPWANAVVEKAVFSPFGNQIIISTPPSGKIGFDAEMVDTKFALYDEKGVCLDVLNTDLCSSSDGSSRNSFEFLKAGADTKELKFVPVVLNEHGDSNILNKKTGKYPLVYNVNDYGKVVVTDIRISDGEIEIDYYKDGFVLFDPGFVLQNDAGENAEPGGKLGCTLYTDVHYDTNSYTARYVYDNCDETGKPVPPDGSVSAESLEKSFTVLGVFEQSYITLDYDDAMTVDLKKIK